MTPHFLPFPLAEGIGATGGANHSADILRTVRARLEPAARRANVAA
jgi:hypothetical protein